MLVDTHGVIVFKGHPATRNLEEDIDALLKGEKITGKGTEAEVAEKGEEEKSGGSSTSEAENASAKDIFRNQAREFMDAKKEALEGLPKAFLYLIDASSFDVKTGTFSHQLTCHTVLTGAAAQVELVRDAS